jgi:hypothetical protein
MLKSIDMTIRNVVYAYLQEMVFLSKLLILYWKTNQGVRFDLATFYFESIP